MHQERLTFAVLMAVLASQGGTFAQGSPPPAAAAIAVSTPTELYDAAAAVSGSPIAGLAIGLPGKLLSVDQLQLVSPGKGEAFCIHAITQDGRYTLRGVYKSPPAPEADWVAIRPLTSRFTTQLRGVEPAQFALRAFSTKDGSCNPQGALHLPQFNGGDPVLTIVANGGSRSGVAELFDDGAGSGSPPISKAACRRAASGARIAFDLRCELALPSRPTATTLRVAVTFDDGFGTEVSSLRVFVPPMKAIR